MPNFQPSLAMTTLPATWPSRDQGKTASNGDWDLSFHNLLGIVNPLQHLPVIGTLYRAITGDKIGTPEKIAGDALYGGLWGAVSSIADTAFEAATGKDFGDTVLALFTGGDKSATAVAAAPAASAPAATNTPVAAAVPPSSADVVALTNALSQKGVDSDVARRALMAYQRSVALPMPTLPTPLLAAAQ